MSQPRLPLDLDGPTIALVALGLVSLVQVAMIATSTCISWLGVAVGA